MARGVVCKEDQGRTNKALEKNRYALRAVGLDGASRDLIGTPRIGVWTGGARPASAALLAEALGELLGRFWRNMGGESGRRKSRMMTWCRRLFCPAAGTYITPLPRPGRHDMPKPQMD